MRSDAIGNWVMRTTLYKPKINQNHHRMSIIIENEMENSKWKVAIENHFLRFPFILHTHIINLIDWLGLVCVWSKCEIIIIARQNAKKYSVI